MSEVETDRLKLFAAYARLGTMRGAARECNVSASAISKSIRTLEDQLGAPLTTRAGRSLQLTSTGRLVASHAERILGDVASLRHDLHYERIGRVAPRIRLATFGPFSSHLLGALIARAPTLATELQHAAPGDLERQVATDRADLGVTLLPVPTDGVEFDSLADIEFRAYARGGAFRGVAFEAVPFVVPLVPLPHAMPTTGGGGDGWPDDRFPRRVLHRVMLFEAMLQTCSHGSASACLPDFAVALHNARCRASDRLEPLSQAPECTIRLAAVTVRPVHMPQRPELVHVTKVLRQLLSGRP